MTHRHFSPVDSLIINADTALRTLFGQPKVTDRVNPADSEPETELSETEQKHIAGLMRINHTGEVCAQALYQGQALTARLDEVRGAMENAAREENDHLDWCEQRVKAMNSHTSLLNPAWYAASFAIGAAAGAAGDRWSLGFVAETEHQVVKHLEDHIERLPSQDNKSRAILEQMKEDELHHATTALEAGGESLPAPIKLAMTVMSKVMTTTAYRI